MNNALQFSQPALSQLNAPVWAGSAASVAFDGAGMKARLLNLAAPCFVVKDGQGRIGITNKGGVQPAGGTAEEMEIVQAAPPILPQQLGDPAFLSFHGLDSPYSSGAMANGIASEELVIALGQAGMLGSFGAAGLVPDRVRAAIQRIQQALPNGPYAFNLIHSPNEENLERSAVEMYLQHGVRTIEASAFLGLTPHVVRYRAAGLSTAGGAGQIEIKTKSSPKSRGGKWRPNLCSPPRIGFCGRWWRKISSPNSRPRWLPKCRWPTTSPPKPTPAATPITARWSACCPQ